MLGLTHSICRFWLFLWLFPTKLIAAPSIVGEAYSIDGATLLYREFYQRQDNDVWHVNYVDPKGKMIANKILNYRDSSVKPNFTLKNVLANQYTAVQAKNFANKNRDAFVIFHGVLDDVKNIKQKEVITSQAVIDAGFDNFVRENWGLLLQGKVIKYNFAVPTKLTMLAMQTHVNECDSSLIDALDTNKNTLICMKTTMRNVMLRVLVPPIQLVYRAETKQLLRFKGLGNIARGDGKLMEVDIRYTYLN